MKYLFVAAGALCLATPAFAQEEAEKPKTDAEWMAWVPDPATIAKPDLTFAEDQEDLDNYEKYYYFHRPETGFETALADLRECDANARGLVRGDFTPDPTAAMVQYGVLAGAAGGLVVGLLADAILGPAELRRKRRVNMRRCMFYMGYSRYGLDKDVWETFNFEEGSSSVAEADRQRMLAQQALVASGSRPEAKELGL